MRLLVCGPRSLTDHKVVFNWIRAIDTTIETVQWVIEGDALGVDQFAGLWATGHNRGLRVFPADWKSHGTKAGPIRNQQMLDEGNPTHVLAFQPTGVKTIGTQDMIRRAKKAGIPTIIVEY